MRRVVYYSRRSDLISSPSRGWRMIGRIATDPAWDAARDRWRSAADRLWAAALVDDEGYRRVAADVGSVLEAMRRTVSTPAALLGIEAEPGELRAAAGTEAELSPLVVGAACAVRADEIEAERARERRAARVSAARAQARTWVLVDEGVTRSVRMHLRTGLALVLIDDPYRDRDPYGLGEVALMADTGEPLVGHGVDEDWFAARGDRDAALARRQAEIESLDDGRPVVSDRQ